MKRDIMRILFVEDLPSDAELAVLELRKEGLRFEHMRVDTRDEFIKALKEFKPDIVISDYMMPAYNGMQALKDAHELDPLVPFILCTGSMNEETAVECLKTGANDYVIKEHLTRLPFAVKEAHEQHRIRIEKRAAELLLKENEEKLQSIFSASPVGIGLFVDKVFMEVNDTFCKMTGYSRKELIGKNSEMVYAYKEEYDNAVIEIYGQIAEKGTGSVETRFKCKDGRILNIFLSSTPLDKDDLTKGVTFTVMDITERKQAEEALVESEMKYRQLVTQSPDGIFVIDLSGKFISVNRAICDNLKYTEKELLSMMMWDIVPEQYHSLHKQRLMVIMNGESTNASAEYEVVGKDGIGHFVEVLSVPYYKGKEIAGFQGIARDITERKKTEEALRESEEKYRLLIDTANESIIVAQDGLLKFVNNITIELLEVSSEQELIGRPFSEFIHPDDRRMVVENYRRRIANEAAQQRYAFRVVTRNGIVKWVELNAVLFEWQGKPATLNFLSDITERKRAEEELRESVSSLRDAQEIAKMGSWEWDIVTQKTTWSDNYFAIHGFKPAEIEPSFEFFRNRIHPDDLHFLDETHAKIMKDKTPSSLELRLIQPDGTFKWIQNNISPVIEDDKLVKLKGVIIDITEHKQAEDKLRSSEERLKILFDYAPDAYYLNDLKGNFIDGNIAAEKLMGYDKNELIGKSFLKLNLLSLKQMPRAAKLLIKNSLGLGTGPDEFVLSRKDRSKVSVEIITHPVKIKDKTLVLGLARDISERKRAEKALQESEEKFRSIMENSADAMFLIDQQGRIVYANKEVINMLGYTIEEVKSKTIVDLSPADRIDEYLNLFSQALKEGRFSFELDILRKDGDIISTDLNSALLPNGLLYASCRDIEIRTPMNAVLGYTELLSSTPVDQTQKNYINSIKSSGKSLLTLINDILDLSKIEAGKLEMEYEYVDTYSFFSEFERIFSLKVSEKELKFILDITSGTPAGINIDEARVRQIVFNLIGNAIKFTSEGKIVLKVFTENPQIVNYSKEKSEELIDLIIEVQ
ncbi:MAG: PAS domain S-box protein, partial [Bacteroidia bacterium]|nr:PAS domain S-box protein [Bacteroidia bacterium]